MSSLSSALRFELAAAAAAAAKNNWLARKLSGYPTSFVYLLLLLLLLLSWPLLASNGASQRGACYADPEGTLFSAVATKCARKRAKCAPKSTQFCSNLTTLADRIGSVRFGSDRIGSAGISETAQRLPYQICERSLGGACSMPLRLGQQQTVRPTDRLTD